MKELKVGMYVRTPKGIAKIVDCSDNELIKIDNGQVILRSDVIKARHKIIDLIEVGDYVNGEFVIQTSPEMGWIFTQPTYFDEHRGEERHYCYNSYEIKSIVTKEQFDSIKYEVE